MVEPRSAILQGTLDLMVLKTLEQMGPLHGYGIARRIEQVGAAGGHRQSGDDLSVPGAAPAEALDLRQVGDIREQPQGEVLRDYQSRTRAAQSRDRELGTHLRRHRPRAAAGRGLPPSLGEGGS